MSLLSDWGFGAQKTGDELDAKLSVMNTADYSKGGRIYDEIAATQGTDAADKDAAAVQSDLSSGATGDVAGSIEDAFKTGWGEGEQNVLNFTKSTINTVGGQAFKIAFGGIPWWLWIVALVVLLFYTGVGQSLVKRYRSP